MLHHLLCQFEAISAQTLHVPQFTADCLINPTDCRCVEIDGLIIHVIAQHVVDFLNHCRAVGFYAGFLIVIIDDGGANPAHAFKMKLHSAAVVSELTGGQGNIVSVENVGGDCALHNV